MFVRQHLHNSSFATNSWQLDFRDNWMCSSVQSVRKKKLRSYQNYSFSSMYYIRVSMEYRKWSDVIFMFLLKFYCVFKIIKMDVTSKRIVLSQVHLRIRHHSRTNAISTPSELYGQVFSWTDDYTIVQLDITAFRSNEGNKTSKRRFGATNRITFFVFCREFWRF